MIRSKISAALTLAVFVALALPRGAQAPAESDAPAEATLTLVDEERFDAGWPGRWVQPPGWASVVMGEGYGVRVAGAQAGLKSTARPNGVFGDVLVEGQFTFTGPDGTAQLFVRDSAVGAYVAQLEAAGAVALEKRGPGGAVLSSSRAQAEPQAVPGAARTMQLSAMGGALRVTVDGIDVLTAADPAPLPPGSNRIGAIFATPVGALTFDNYSVSVPAEVAPETSAPAAPALAPALGAPMASAAANDNFADRNTAVGGRYLSVGHNSSAALEAGEPIPSLAADIDRTVWYEFTPPASRSYLLTTFGSSFDTVLAVYTDSNGGAANLADLVQVDFSDNVPGSLSAQLTLALDSTNTYYIQLGGRKSAGNFEFRIMDPADVAVPSTPAISTSAPAAPTPPVADQAATNTQQPVLAWEPRPSITPYAYLPEISTGSTFPSILSSSVIEDPTRFWEVAPALPLPGSPTGEKYYWRVAALNFLGQTSTFSPAYSFTLDTQPLAPPALISPALNGAVETLRPTFTWQPIPGATGYHFRIATNFSLSTPESPGNDIDVTPATFTPSVDLAQGEYWYGAKSRDAAGNWSEYGEKRRFTVNVSKTPAHGANVITSGGANTADVVLTWTGVPGATYTLEVATDSSFSIFDSYGPLTTTSYTLTGRPHGTYFWRVTVNGLSLPISLARHFNVTPPLPDAPLLQTTGAISGALTDKALTNNPSPSFDWTVPANWVPPAPGQSLTYELQLATDSKFTQGVVEVTGIGLDHYEWNRPPLPPTPNTTYYWRVRARTNLGLFGAYSKVFTFTLDTGLLDNPIVTSPVLNSQGSKVVTGQRPVIKWKPVKGAVRYHVVIATNFNGTTTVVDTFVNGTSFTPSFDLALGTHFLFVHAEDAAGNVRPPLSLGPPAIIFDVNLGQAPANATVLVAKAPATSIDVVFTWERMQGATTYRLEVAVDGDTSFTGDVRGFDVIGTTHTVTIPATSVSMCYWRVYKAGTTPPAGYYLSFSALNSAPTGPSIQAGGLVQDDVITSLTPAIFQWTTPPNAAVYNYQLQLATDRKFSQLLLNTIQSPSNATTYPQDPLPPGTYYWRVRALYQPSGIHTPYSPTYRFTVVEASATMPVLTAPAADAILSTARPKFQWKPVAFSQGYRLRLITNPSGTPMPFGPDVELTKTAYTPPDNLPQGEYSVAVESKDPQGDWSGFAEQRRFVINYGISPADQAALVAKAPAFTTDVIFKWSKLPPPNSANTLRIQVDNHPDFSSPSATSPILAPSTTTYTLTNQPVGTYYWRLLVTGHAAAPASLAYRYTITPPLPVAPLIENAIPAVTNDATPRFDWKVPANWVTPPAGSSLSYQLQVATDRKFTQLVGSTVDIPSVPPDTHYDWPMELTPGSTYYWRVRGVTNLNVPGAFSKAASFTVDVTAPTQPVPKTPADAIVSTSSRPKFSWTAGTNGAVLYRLDISDHPLFAAPPVYSASTPKLTHTPTQSLPQGVYYWRVHGLDQAGNGGDVLVPSRTVTIDYRTAPEEGDIIEVPTAAGVPVNFKWVAPLGAPTGMTYTIEIDTDLDGTTDTALTPVTTLTTTSAALPPGYYHYRLVASNGFGTTGWREFVVVPQ